MVEPMHLASPGTLNQGEDGQFIAKCTCGYELSPLPDIETVVDLLMGHAWHASWVFSEKLSKGSQPL